MNLDQNADAIIAKSDWNAINIWVVIRFSFQCTGKLSTWFDHSEVLDRNIHGQMLISSSRTINTFWSTVSDQLQHLWVGLAGRLNGLFIAVRVDFRWISRATWIYTVRSKFCSEQFLNYSFGLSDHDRPTNDHHYQRLFESRNCICQIEIRFFTSLRFSNYPNRVQIFRDNSKENKLHECIPYSLPLLQGKTPWRHWRNRHVRSLIKRGYCGGVALQFGCNKQVIYSWGR